MKPECGKCVHRVTFVSTENEPQTIRVCSGDGWEENDDGSMDLIEVSEFDASDCLMFKEKQ
jgi:hypothetical protein